MNIIHFAYKFDDTNVFCLQKACFGGIMIAFWCIVRLRQTYKFDRIEGVK